MDRISTATRVPRPSRGARVAMRLSLAAVVLAVALPPVALADTAPTLSSLSPNTVAADAGGVTLLVAGDGVTDSSTLQWRGSDYPVDWIVVVGEDGSSLGASIPGSALDISEAFETVLVTVTSGGAVSNPRPVTILGPGVGSTQSVVGGAGGSVTATTDRVSATYTRAGGGFGTLTVVDYQLPPNPVLPPSPISPVAFLDVQLLNAGPGDTLIGTFLPPNPIVPPNPILPPSPILPPNPIRLAWWTGASWAPVVGSGSATTIFSFDASTTSASAASVTFDLTSSPAITALGGTVFAFVAAYAFEGFAAPLGSDVNIARAGRSVPLKWRTLDLGGTPLAGLDPATVKLSSVRIACDSLSGEAEALDAYAPGSSGLQDLGDGFYQWNWATDKAWAGTCRLLRLELGDRHPDGSPIYRTAAFDFRR